MAQFQFSDRNVIGNLAMELAPIISERMMKSDKIVSFVKLITPKHAEALLATSPGNRIIREWYVDLLADAIKRGEWLCSHQGIAFDKQGQLRDGHHRLLACIKANTSISILCTLGLDEQVYDVIDQGINRRVSDILALDKRIAEPLRLGATYAFSQQKPTIQQIRQIADAGLQKLLEVLINYCGTTRKYIASAPAKLAAVMQMYRHPADQDWILSQYQAGCLLNFDAMSNNMQAFCRQTMNERGKMRIESQWDVIARAMQVFDKDKADNKRLIITDELRTNTINLVRCTLKEMLDIYVQSQQL